MTTHTSRKLSGVLLASTAIGLAGAAQAQVGPAPSAAASEPQEAASELGEVVVTGSRIRRSDPTTAAPVQVVTAQSLTDRGFVQVGQGLNDLTSMAPSVPLAPDDFSGESIGSGRQYPSLLGLGSERTLTLVNGRRFVSSANGLSGNQVDTNLIPSGLLRQVDVVQGGGAAVYGSDAMAGVVNYILRDDFDGLTVDAQTGISSRDDYATHSLRLTVGRNFADGRANLAANVEWSKSDPLMYVDRPASARGAAPGFFLNPDDTGPNDGRPDRIVVEDLRLPFLSPNGIIFTGVGGGAVPIASFPFILTRGGPAGSPVQFGDDGQSIVNYNPGRGGANPPVFGSGGDGLTWAEYTGALFGGVERQIVNGIGRYDLTDTVRLSGELTYARTTSEDTRGAFFTGTASPRTSDVRAIAFNRNNPFLTPALVAELSALNPAFAGGGNLFLSKYYRDLLPSYESRDQTDVWRGVIALEGDFTRGDRDFYWSVAASSGRTVAESRSWDVLADEFARATDVTRNGAGNIVCAVNATTVTDPSCAPLNPFGQGNISAEARAYTTGLFGQDYENRQTNLLATFGGDLITLPAGDLGFSVAYEHRREKASFSPSENTARGRGPDSLPVVGQSGSFDTHEFSAEVLIPILGEDFTLPFAESLELTGAYRHVENSIAGSEGVWGAGLRWGVTSDLTFRVSRSRNFRAPSLSELILPPTLSLQAVASDPCDRRNIDTRGPNPAVRRANCEAEWAANPGRAPLATFEDPTQNIPITPTTTGGNLELESELSDNFTWGVVWQPSFVEGLTIVADRIELDLTNGLTLYQPSDFLGACYDTPTRSEEFCGAFTRDPVTGQVATLSSKTVNVGQIRYRGEIYNINYTTDLNDLFAGSERNLGTLDLNFEATHVELREDNPTGFQATESQDTTSTPDWRVRFDARYSVGPLRLGYSMNYLPEVKSGANATVENSAVPVIAENIRHGLSAQYELNETVTLRAGVENLTDEEPSYPTLSYGDIIGRNYYVGLRASF